MSTFTGNEKEKKKCHVMHSIGNYVRYGYYLVLVTEDGNIIISLDVTLYQPLTF